MAFDRCSIKDYLLTYLLRSFQRLPRVRRRSRRPAPLHADDPRRRSDDREDRLVDRTRDFAAGWPGWVDLRVENISTVAVPHRRTVRCRRHQGTERPYSIQV